MSIDESGTVGLASEQIYGQIEENMEPGGVRDLWVNLRNELVNGGPQGVGSYLESEYQRRKGIVENALIALTSQFEEIS